MVCFSDPIKITPCNHGDTTEGCPHPPCGGSVQREVLSRGKSKGPGQPCDHYSVVRAPSPTPGVDKGCPTQRGVREILPLGGGSHDDF